VLFKLGVIASLSESHLRYDADALFAARQIACIAAPRHRWNSSPLVSRRSPAGIIYFHHKGVFDPAEEAVPIASPQND